MSKEELIRKLMFVKMERAETALARNCEIEQWVKENPSIVAKVEQRIKNVSAANRTSAFIKVAKVEAVRQGMRAPRVQS